MTRLRVPFQMGGATERGSFVVTALLKNRTLHFIRLSHELFRRIACKPNRTGPEYMACILLPKAGFIANHLFGVLSGKSSHNAW